MNGFEDVVFTPFAIFNPHYYSNANAHDFNLISIYVGGEYIPSLGPKLLFSSHPDPM